ncbi:hypothetical protein [Azospirillum sp. Sh1]|uniref:hypothetical protein n=1 Tax=Azospirillum sp. Sh1 TaxID=2607285 RepID=UPI0011ED871D|nr:hypothetical protein [Azospirillum sp. Sh1]KAA0577669.1 hypothetical protein FZ029_11000 [Azospirillum sp. Sh1]
MFSKIRSIRQLVRKSHVANTLPYHIQPIRDSITQICNIDKISFIKFEEPDNPIIGRYLRYEGAMGVYSAGTCVDVQYSSQLNYCWSRFVVCKEMCHALLDDMNNRVSSPNELLKLVDHLLLPETSREVFAAFPAFASERLAALAALELLCPIEDRMIVSKKRQAGTVSDAKIAEDFRIPRVIIKTAFDPKYIDFVAKLINSDL